MLPERISPDWGRAPLAPLNEPTVLGVADSYGIELIHPRREKRSPKQIGKKGKSNQRWMIGVKLCVLLNKFGLVVDLASDTSNVYDSRFHPLIKKYEEQTLQKGILEKSTRQIKRFWPN